MNKLISIFTVFLVFGFGINISWAEGVFVYEKPKVAHPGKELTPLDAYALIKEDPDHMIIRWSVPGSVPVHGRSI